MNKEITKTHHSHIGHYNGKPVYKFRLTNCHGNYAEFINYGAIVKSIVVPDRNGNKENVILGYPTLQGYLSDAAYIGATVGPFANRIANASFKIGAEIYNLESNDGQNSNHSGSAGFNNKVFDFEMQDDRLIFSLNSPDGEGGFPGNLHVKVSYSFTDDNELIIKYFAETDKPTPVNFTNHAYFNLTGNAGTIHKHRLGIASNLMLESTAAYIPTGKIVPADEHAFGGQSLGSVMKDGGINTYYIFDDTIAADALVCVLFDEASGRTMQVYTTYPGVQLYTGDYLNNTAIGLNGQPHMPFSGLCLECQYYPDSPNHNNFPNTILQPGNTYNETITYTFGIQP